MLDINNPKVIRDIEFKKVEDKKDTDNKLTLKSEYEGKFGSLEAHTLKGKF